MQLCSGWGRVLIIGHCSVVSGSQGTTVQLLRCDPTLVTVGLIEVGWAWVHNMHCITFVLQCGEHPALSFRTHHNRASRSKEMVQLGVAVLKDLGPNVEARMHHPCACCPCPHHTTPFLLHPSQQGVSKQGAIP